MEQSISDPSVTKLKRGKSRKIKYFIWQALSGFVTSASRLCDRHCATDRSCLRCGAEEETINHILFECPPALQCWALSDISISSGRIPCSALFTNIDHLLSRAAEQGVSREIIRKGRNNKIFNGVDTSPLDTLQVALAEAKSWKVAQIIPEAEDDLGQSREAANKHGEGPQSQWVAVTKLMPHGLKQIR